LTRAGSEDPAYEDPAVMETRPYETF